MIVTALISHFSAFLCRKPKLLEKQPAQLALATGGENHA